MGVTVQVRNLDAAVQDQLARAAAQEGLSLSAFLRRELTNLAEGIALMERARRLGITNPQTIQGKLGGPFPELKNISTQQIVDIIREGREERDQ